MDNGVIFFQNVALIFQVIRLCLQVFGIGDDIASIVDSLDSGVINQVPDLADAGA